MNSTFSFGQYEWFIGLVTDINDPEKMGRVKVVAYGFHVTSATEYDQILKRAQNNFDSVEKDFNTKGYWASLIHPVTSASFGQVGTSHGLRPGSQVVGFFADGKNAQQPIIQGSLSGQSKPLIPTNKLRTKSTELFEEYAVPDTNRLNRNQEIDQTLIDKKKQQISKSKSAYKINSIVGQVTSRDKLKNGTSLLDSLTIGKSLLTDLKKDVLGSLGKDLTNSVNSKMMKNLNNIMNPSKLLDRALKQQGAQHNSQLRNNIASTINAVGFTECAMLKFADQIQGAIANVIAAKLATLLEDQLAALLPEIDISELLDDTLNFIDDAEYEIAMAEATLLNNISSTVGALTDLPFAALDNIAGNIQDAIGGVLNTISESVNSAMDSILSQIGELDQNNLVKLQTDISKAMAIAVDVNIISSQVESVFKDISSGGLASVMIDNVVDQVEDTIDTFESTLKNFNLDPSKCR